MIFGSICSGIEAASVAWAPLGWACKFVSEIDPAAAWVLHQRFGAGRPMHMPQPEQAKDAEEAEERRAAIKTVARIPIDGRIPNYGDFTKIGPDAGPVDLLVGGTPCQDFSVAGQRAGLDGARGNLTLAFAGLAEKLGARWFLWENVPGVFSSNEGADFGAVIACFSGHEQPFVPPKDKWRNAGAAPPASAECYGLAWRTLDAQFVRVDGFGRAVPQRRRRVFVVGRLGDWRPAAAVLFEPACLQGDPAPRREAGQGLGPTLGARALGGGGLGTDAELDGALVPVGGFQDGLASGPVLTKWAKGSGGPAGNELSNMVALPGVAHALRGDGHDASEDGTGRGTPIVPVCFDSKGSEVATRDDEATPALRAMGHANGGGQLAVAFTIHGTDKTAAVASQTDVAGSVRTRPPGAQENSSTTVAVQAVAFDLRGREGGVQFEGPHDTANIRAADGGSSRSYVAFAENQRSEVRPLNVAGALGGIRRGDGKNETLMAQGVADDGLSWAVRRLTPLECERLQGFPDGHTRVLVRVSKKPPSAKRLEKYGDLHERLPDGRWATFQADGPRYKQLGNSMPVNVIRWIGTRIAMVEEALSAPGAAP